MAYTAPPTKSPGDLLTSALWNTYIQGNADSGFCRMIADSTLGGAAATVDFASLPQTFAHLFAVIHARGDVAAPSTTIVCRFNNDSAGDYDYSSLAGIGTTASGAGSGAIGSVSGATAPANTFAGYLLWIPHYAQANTFKVCQTLGLYQTASGGGNVQPAAQSIVWKATPAALNRITFLPGSGNFVANSRFTIYGLPA